MTRFGTISLIGVAASLAAAGTAAAQPPSDDRDLLGFTCGEYLLAAQIADPGPKPDSKRAEQSAAAQDDIANVMLWLHGYQTGRAGAGAAPAPLTRSWMIDQVGKLAKVCIDKSKDGKMPLYEAAKRL